MANIWQAIIRMSSFLRKEIFEVLRQPRLLLTLVLGPFLILLLFGIGYRNTPRSLRTLFVVEQNSPLKQDIEKYAKTLGPQLIYAGVTSDKQAALEKLRTGQVDLVAVAPVNAYETIRSSKQAVFTLYHHEIDPFQVDYIKYFGQVYIDEVNRRVLLAITVQGQSNASTVKSDLQKAKSNAAALHQAIKAGDMLAAQQNQVALSQNLDNISLGVGASLGLLSGVQGTLGGGGQNDAAAILAALSGLKQNTNALSASNLSASGATSQDEARAAKVENDLNTLEKQLNEFTSIDPNVLVRPFTSETKSIAAVQPTALDFFSPAVIALLLQHLTVTFAALSIVHERSIGTMELFRVSPLSSGETLLGKYLSYMIFGTLLAAALTLLLIYVLHVPMLGNWVNYALVILALMFASLGFGFFISLVAQSDSQAVQYTMILLLTSVFFSGFLMSLEMIWKPVRVISWALPTTYGIVLLRDIMLRGLPPSILLLGGMTAIGVGLCIVDWLLLRRMISAV